MPTRCCSCRRKPIFLLAFVHTPGGAYFPTSMDTVSHGWITHPAGEQCAIPTARGRFSCALPGGQGRRNSLHGHRRQTPAGIQGVLSLFREAHARRYRHAGLFSDMAQRLFRYLRSAPAHTQGRVWPPSLILAILALNIIAIWAPGWTSCVSSGGLRRPRFGRVRASRYRQIPVERRACDNACSWVRKSEWVSKRAGGGWVSGLVNGWMSEWVLSALPMQMCLSFARGWSCDWRSVLH